MFEGMTYDELNELVTNPRSEPPYEYFGVMELSEQEKRRRIALAEDLEDDFLEIFILLFTMQQYHMLNWEKARKKFEDAYIKNVSKVFKPDKDFEVYIKKFSYDIIDATKNHASDPYYYSEDRCRMISCNESNNSMSYREFDIAVESGKTMKEWVDIRDRKERKTHREVGGTRKPINEPFLVGDSLMMYAHDGVTFGADVKELANCRCTTKYY